MELNSILDIKWEPVTKRDLVYLDINKELSMQHDLLKDRAAVWDEALGPL
jgi:hypothetical protein